MSQTENGTAPVASVDEMQRTWHDLNLRLRQLEVGNVALEHENKNLRQLMERIVQHRKKSHGDLVNLLTTLVSKLPINDVAVVVSRLVEHNAQVGDVCAAPAGLVILSTTIGGDRVVDMLTGDQLPRIC